ncbi:hydroxylysine kinase isoform X2 [Amia ocellicauda]|uniref:hydroxylysine kinase isoform X2 n=1 Tax=Amia ocellicauda TaxID=2972642 RepID=UPI003463A41B
MCSWSLALGNMSTEVIKPCLSETQASELVGRVFGLHVDRIHPLPSYDDQNFHVVVSGGGEYVLKIMNSMDSRDPEMLDVQTHAMMFLREKGLPTPTVLPTLQGETMSLQAIDCGSDCKQYIVRLLTYIPGTPLAKIPTSSQSLFEVGRMAATIDKVLQEMEHHHLQRLNRENFIWSLSNVHLLERYLTAMDGDPSQQVVRNIIELYKSQVQPRLGYFRKCINHGDFNDHNILIEPEKPAEGINSNGFGEWQQQEQQQKRYRICGVLDFGDMYYGYYVFEVATTLMYMMIESKQPLEVGGPVLAGYESVIPLTAEERDVLYLLVLCRFCQSLVMARHTVLLHPENEEYLMITARTGKGHLLRLWKMGKEAVEQLWFTSASSYHKATDRQ